MMVVMMSLANLGLAQHCPPLSETYLSSVKLKHSKEGIDLDVVYSKVGGQIKPAYQAYLLAFTESNARRIAELTAQQAIREKLAVVVDTTLIKRAESGDYPVRWQLNTTKFVESLQKEKLISKERVDDAGGWMSFSDEIHLAVFIPFLEDKQYSKIEGLPADKHECNYANESALLFESISTSLSINFGIVQAVRLPEESYYIQLNSSSRRIRNK